MKSQCFSAVLLLWLLAFSTTSQDSIVKTSCLTTSDTKIPQRFLDSYTMQETHLFSVRAVRFRTTKGATICSDPTSLWAIKSMNYLDGKKKKKSHPV